MESVAPSAPPPYLPRGRKLKGAERSENFPVALRVLPRRLRADLRAVYDVVRVIDELGDAAAGDRTDQLHRFADDLGTIWNGGEPQTPVLKALVPTIRSCALPEAEFQSLIAANLQDQHVTCYRTHDELMQYCMLSAAPIGRLVLAVFGAGSPNEASPEQVALSDRVCCALQLVEHLQDIAEDYRAGRVYLPRTELEHFGVHRTDLAAPTASTNLRHLISAEAERAATMLDSGTALIASLHGWGCLAVAGYVAGGRAAVVGLRRVHFDVLGCSASAHRRDVARHLVREWGRATW